MRTYLLIPILCIAGLVAAQEERELALFGRSSENKIVGGKLLTDTITVDFLGNPMKLPITKIRSADFNNGLIFLNMTNGDKLSSPLPDTTLRFASGGKSTELNLKDMAWLELYNPAEQSDYCLFRVEDLGRKGGWTLSTNKNARSATRIDGMQVHFDAAETPGDWSWLKYTSEKDVSSDKFQIDTEIQVHAGDPRGDRFSSICIGVGTATRSSWIVFGPQQVGVRKSATELDAAVQVDLTKRFHRVRIVVDGFNVRVYVDDMDQAKINTTRPFLWRNSSSLRVVTFGDTEHNRGGAATFRYLRCRVPKAKVE